MRRSKVVLALGMVLFLATGWVWAVVQLPVRIDPDAQLDRITDARPSLQVPGIVRLDVRAFYRDRGFAPAWVTERAPGPLVDDALHVLDGATAYGLKPQSYDAASLRADHHRLATVPAASRSTARYRRDLLDFDVRLTSALLTLGYDVAAARTRRAGVNGPDLPPPDAPPNLPRALSRAIEADANLAGWLDGISPRRAAYQTLNR